MFYIDKFSVWAEGCWRHYQAHDDNAWIMLQPRVERTLATFTLFSDGIPMAVIVVENAHAVVKSPSLALAGETKVQVKFRTEADCQRAVEFLSRYCAVRPAEDDTRSLPARRTTTTFRPLSAPALTASQVIPPKRVLPWTIKEPEKDLKQYASQPDAVRQAVIDKMICDHLDDDGFKQLCKDVENAWRRVGL